MRKEYTKLNNLAIGVIKYLQFLECDKSFIADKISGYYGVSYSTPYRYLNSDENKYKSETWQERIERENKNTEVYNRERPRGEAIRRIMDRHGWNTKQVAEHLNMDLGEVNRLATLHITKSDAELYND